MFRPGAALAVALLVALSGGSLRAQDEDYSDPVAAYNKAVSSIQLKKWDEALKVLGVVIDTNEDSAMKRYGPVFGHFHFLKGLALLGKEELDGAVEAFRTCYEKYSNEILTSGTDGDTKNLKPNLFRNSALVQWANCEMKREQYAAARDLYEKVLKEGANDAKVNLVFVGVNLGRCYLKSGDLEKGYDFMARPLANENLSEGLRETIFMVMAEDWTPAVDFSRMREFLNQHGDIVDFDPFLERYERNHRFHLLAQKALQGQDPVRALAWYERMVNPRELRDDFRRRHDSLANRPVAAELEEKKVEALKELQQQIAQLETGYRQILNGVGSAHFMIRNFAGSYVAFSRLCEEAGKDHPDRALFLHNAVVSAVQIERWTDAYGYGRQFLDEFPGDHPLRPGVARVLVEVLFLREEYEQAYEVAGEVRQSMTEGESIRDIPDFVYGAAAFQLGKTEEADVELSKYFKIYPDGERKEMAKFFLGLAKVRLSQWEEAALVMNEFLAEYPQSSLVPTVLYQGAMSEFMLDRPDPSLAKVERIHAEFPGADVAAPAWNLKGDIFSSQEREFDEIVACYLKARDGGRETRQPETAAYALWQLVAQTVGAEMWADAETHYADFREGHADSEFRYDVLAAALPMLVEQGMVDEGLEQLRAVVWEHRDEPESPVLSEMFGTYADFLESNYEHSAALAELDALASKRGVTPCLKGWLTVARADLLEKADAPQEEIDKLFYLLEAGFDPAAHSNFPIVRLARWVAEVRKKPGEALPLYQYILENRPGTPNYDYCLVDMGQIQAESGDPAQRAEAMEKFQRVLAEVPDEELQEKAVLGLARIQTEEQNYPEAQKYWETYLENRGWTLSRPEANYQVGHCLEQQGNYADALKIYVSVYANFPGHLDWSTRAYLRTAAITKGTGEDLKALKVLQDMLQRMGHLEHPGVAKGKELFVKWRSEYTPETEDAEG